jgi:DNA-binding LytR/AlgR family response regulator
MKAKLKVLILDDEYPARKELRYHLEQYDYIQIVGEATNAEEALELIRAVDYSVVFLDIDMPGKNGLQLGEQLKSSPKPPAIVYVTAYNNYALDAFAVNAVDYLLKPIDPDRLTKALDKVNQVFFRQQNTEVPQQPEPQIAKPSKQPLEMIPVEHNGKILLINETEIIYVFASNDYTYIKTQGKKYLTRFTLKELEIRIKNTQFYRCHRSYLINLKKIKEVIPLYNGTLTLVVDDQEGSKVPVSRSQVKRVRELLGL